MCKPPKLLGRERAIATLRNAAPGRVAFYGLESPEGVPAYVHAKVCIIDDQWASVGPTASTAGPGPTTPNCLPRLRPRRTARQPQDAPLLLSERSFRDDVGSDVCMPSAGPVRGDHDGRFIVVEYRCQGCSPSTASGPDAPGCPRTRVELSQRTRPGGNRRVRRAVARLPAHPARSLAQSRHHVRGVHDLGDRLLPDRSRRPLRVGRPWRLCSRGCVGGSHGCCLQCDARRSWTSFSGCRAGARARADAPPLGRWSASGPTELFPVMEADLEIAPMGTHQAQLRFSGRQLDRLLMHQFAQVTMRAMPRQLVANIVGSLHPSAPAFGLPSPSRNRPQVPTHGRTGPSHEVSGSVGDPGQHEKAPHQRFLWSSTLPARGGRFRQCADLGKLCEMA